MYSQDVHLPLREYNIRASSVPYAGTRTNSAYSPEPGSQLFASSNSHFLHQQFPSNHSPSMSAPSVGLQPPAHRTRSVAELHPTGKRRRFDLQLLSKSLTILIKSTDSFLTRLACIINLPRRMLISADVLSIPVALSKHSCLSQKKGTNVDTLLTTTPLPPQVTGYCANLLKNIAHKIARLTIIILIPS